MFRRLCTHVKSRQGQVLLRNRSFASMSRTVYTPSVEVSGLLKQLSEQQRLFRTEISPNAIFEAIDTLGPHRVAPGLVGVSYRTQGHQQLFDILLNYSQTLRDDEYLDTRGVATALLVGAKGIGKTTSLIAFTNILPIFNPSVIPVYVSFNNMNLIADDNLLRGNTLLQAVCTVLGVEKRTPSELIEALERRGKYLLLMVDELDQLYLEDPTEINRGTLSELAFLGDQSSGRISTLLCGSSAALPNLVTRNFNDFDEWPLLRNAPNLNGTKYSSRRVYTASPVDLEDLDAILQLPEGPEKIKNLRRVGFATGCRVRLVQRIVRDRAQGDFFQACFPEESTQSYNTMKVRVRKDLLAGILQELRSKNSGLFKDLCPNGVPSPDRIAEVPWEERFEPLRWTEVESIWRDVAHNEPREDILKHVLHLSDRSWLMTKNIVASVPEHIYPSSLYTVLNATEPKSVMESFRGPFWNGLMRVPFALLQNVAVNINYEVGNA